MLTVNAALPRDPQEKGWAEARQNIICKHLMEQYSGLMLRVAD